MHKVEVEFDLLAWSLRCARVIRHGINHLCHFRTQLTGIRPELGCVMDHFLGSPLEYAIADLVAVIPFGRGTQSAIGVDLIEELGNGFLLGVRVYFGALPFDGKEEAAHPIIMHGALRKGFGNDGGLFKFDAEAEVDEGMQEA